MYKKLPTQAFASFLYAAAAGTEQQNIIVAAPGAAFVLRIVWLQINVFTNATIAAPVLEWSYAAIANPSQGRTIYRAEFNYQHSGSGPIFLPEPGLQLNANEALSLFSNAQVTNRTFIANVYYFTDPI